MKLSKYASQTVLLSLSLEYMHALNLLFDGSYSLGPWPKQEIKVKQREKYNRLVPDCSNGWRKM